MKSFTWDVGGVGWEDEDEDDEEDDEDDDDDEDGVNEVERYLKKKNWVFIR